MSSQELQGCPFCGVTPVKATGVLAPRYKIAFVHPRNGCVIEAIDIHEDEIAAWNKRAQPAGEAEPVAWFAFADSNGPVPLEIYGWDEKACRYAVLHAARAEGWKGTVDGYLLHRAWTIRPLYAAPPAAANQAGIPEGYVLVPKEPTEDMHAAAVRTVVKCHGNDDFPPRVWAAMLAAAPHTESHALGGDGE